MQPKAKLLNSCKINTKHRAMKKTLLFIISFLVGVLAYSQSITRDFFPIIGTKIVYARDNSPQQSWSSLDANPGSWDLAWVEKKDSVTVLALDPASTPWASQETGSDYVLTYFTPTDSVYYYYNLTDTGIFQIGVVIYADGQFVPFRYDARTLFMSFPFNQGDTVWSPKTATTSLYGVPVNLTHNDSLIYLASGTLSLPDGMQYSVALIKHYSYINVYAQNLVNETYEDYLYEWYDLDRKLLLASADSSVSLQKFASAQYLDTLNKPSAVAQIMANVKIWPNPTSNTINIKALPHNYSLKIFDMDGKLIFSRQFYHSTQIDVAYLTKGVYIIQLKGKEGTLNLQFIKH